MSAVLVIIMILLTALAVGALLTFLHLRKIQREQKNFERGLKMVPLLIHLPPTSDDIDVGSRDIRDVTDETISKAQIMYNIIASTVQKGFKSKYYGQRHFAFEIVGSKGFVNFYATVPVALVDVVQQAVVSAYPTARLEEVAEHNIFSPVGKITGTIGGELTLKENYAYPIATYQELKRDTMQSILNALSTLDKEDGAGIQILMRPADGVWRKNALALAGKKRKGKDKKKGAVASGGWLRQVFAAPFKPPEHKDGKSGGDSGPDLSGVDQEQINAIEEKSKHAGYEVLIRVIASSNVSQRAQSVLSNVVATFALFDAPGRNGFKYSAAKDIDSFVTAYIMRFFPQMNNKNILNAIELATIFHFPDQSNVPTSQLERQASKQVDGPRNVPDEGMLLGYNVFRGAKKAIRLGQGDRARHMYVVGQTGTGKSTFLENMALQDMLSGEGFAFIDPHGDTAEKLLSMVPKERTEDVIYFCPADMDFPIGLNLFEFHSEDQKDFLIQEAINMLYKLYDPQHQGIIGPRYEHWFRMAAQTIMADPIGATFIDIPKVFTDNAYAKQKLKHVTNQVVLDFWNKEMASTSDYHKSEVLGWFVSKFGAFLANEMMRDIIGQTKSSFDLREVMDNKKILLVNLSKGRTGELNSKLLGMIFVMKFQAAAMSRANVPESERTDFCLYVDEFQNFSTDSFATIMSEARKYHLNLIVANQFTTQLTEEIRDAVFGNMGTIISFRIGQNDVESLSRYFQPLFDGDDLLRIPNYNAVVRTLISGVPTQPFSMTGLPPLGTPNKGLGDALKQLSAAKYGRPKAVVEAEIFERLATIEEPKPAGPPTRPPQAGQMGAGAPRPAAAGPKTGSSFLDDWLNKKQTNTFKTPASPFKQPPAGGPVQQTVPMAPIQAPVTPQLAQAQSLPPAAQAPQQMPVQPLQPVPNPQPLPQQPAQETFIPPATQPITPAQLQSAPQPAAQSTTHPKQPDLDQNEGVLHLRPHPQVTPKIEDFNNGSSVINIDDSGQLHHQTPDDFLE